MMLTKHFGAKFIMKLTRKFKGIQGCQMLGIFTT